MWPTLYPPSPPNVHHHSFVWFNNTFYWQNHSFAKLNSRVPVLGNAVNGQGGHDHHSNTHQENYNPAGGGRDPPPLPDNQVPVVQPPRRPKEYNWKQAGATECSASCGKGQSNYSYLRFLTADVQSDLQPEPKESKPEFLHYQHWKKPKVLVM